MRIARILLLLLALPAAFLAIGLINAWRTPVIEEVTLPLAGLPHPVRVLLLSDTHGGFPDMPARRLERIAAQGLAIRPDLVLFAGDYHGGKWLDPPRILEHSLRPLAPLKGPMGAYAVLGNHDTMKWTPRVLAAQGSPLLLVNEARDLGPFVLAGLNSLKHGADLAATLDAIPPDRPVVLLAHEPEQFGWKARPPRPGDILVLAGHTHGGQVVLPLIGSVGDRLTGPAPCRRGLCALNGWRLFVTSGVGTSWLPVRFGVRPEMVLITLVPGDYSGRNSGTDR